ncbi:MAG: GAF domain-containing protein [Gemmatimonadaceae bacterium]|nr:GAF domain-containing protein [Gemmatimonadaceae bacterium]
MSDILELLAIREIAHAFLLADRPSDVQQVALDRVTPILGAAFSLIMQVGDDGELLRPVAQHRWPARHQNWIGALRVRVGDGPSGLAVAERRLVEIPDVFADPSLDAWHEVAEELGFRSIVAAPLIGAEGPVGAIAFYFTDPTPVSDQQRALVRLVADQLAATADKAALIDALRRSNAALADANDALEREARTADADRRRRDRFLTTLTQRIRQSMDIDMPEGRTLEAVRATALAAEELAAVECGAHAPEISEVDPRAPLLDALQGWRARLRTVPITHGEPTVLLPTLRTDGRWLARLLTLLMGQVLQRDDGRQAIHADVELGRGFIAHRFEWSGAPLPDMSPRVSALVDTELPGMARHPSITPLDIALLVSLVRRLGGNVQCDDVRESGTSQGVTVVFPVDDLSP